MILSRQRVIAHRVRNAAQSVLLLAAMGTWTGLLGWLLLGTWGAVAALSAAVVGVMAASRISPWMVLHLYRARPLAPHEAPGLHRIVAQLASRARLPASPTIWWIPSTVPNALSVGSREDPAIAVTDGLLRLLSGREITGVVAHEIGHVTNGDLLVMAIADSFARYTALLGQIGVVLLVFALFLGDPTVTLAAALLAGGPSLSTLLMLGLSRQREFAADLEAVALTHDPQGLASALRRIEQPMRFWERLVGLPGRDPNPSLLRTHPATEERIRRLTSLVAPRRQDPHAEVKEVRLPPIRQAPRRRVSGLWY